MDVSKPLMRNLRSWAAERSKVACRVSKTKNRCFLDSFRSRLCSIIFLSSTCLEAYLEHSLRLLHGKTKCVSSLIQKVSTRYCSVRFLFCSLSCCSAKVGNGRGINCHSFHVAFLQGCHRTISCARAFHPFHPSAQENKFSHFLHWFNSVLPRRSQNRRSSAPVCDLSCRIHPGCQGSPLSRRQPIASKGGHWSARKSAPTPSLCAPLFVQVHISFVSQVDERERGRRTALPTKQAWKTSCWIERYATGC